MKKHILTVGAGLLIAASAFAQDAKQEIEYPEVKEGQLLITTADRGDGKAGLGADTWLGKGGGSLHKGKFSRIIMVRSNYKANNIAVFRFDLSMLKGKKVKDATFYAFGGCSKSTRGGLFGMLDSGENRDELFSERNLGWINFAGINKSEAGEKKEKINWNHDKIVVLGGYYFSHPDKFWPFKSAKLVELINNDTNKAVVLMVTAGNRTTNFVPKEADSKKAARLILTLEKEKAEEEK
jgi:hypothetical protein